jgi:hypothetical protein
LDHFLGARSDASGKDFLKMGFAKTAFDVTAEDAGIVIVNFVP